MMPGAGSGVAGDASGQSSIAITQQLQFHPSNRPAT